MKEQWEILIKDEKAKPVKEKLSEIAETLVKNVHKLESNIGLMGGKIGVALFYFYYAKFLGEDKFADYGVELISDVFDEINKDFTYHTHAGGLAGIGWTVEHLAQNDFIETDTNEVLADLDPYLHKTMIYDIRNENYDFLHGAVGNGVYFLSRMANEKSKDYLKELIDELDKTSHKDEDGALKWLSTLNIEDGTKGYNLSLSHGIASIIVFLGKVLETGIYNEKVSTLLNGAVQYLLKYRLDREKFSSNFPSWISESDPLTASRLAWCYGDLGISIALWQAAQSVGNKDWEKIAAHVLLDSTARKDLKENTVMDAGLCHGAAGIMHIYNRAYHYTGIDTFKELTLYWAEQTLNMATFEDGYAGYKAWHTEKYGGWVPEPGLLEGVTGIGLALISLISDIEPKWDRSLFVS
ncbi:MAG: lanthionine synthetase C family protein [Candidatus Aminicenantes bacterium]|nr:MAG: lanthionine synthetase C family protein [Candidatus Aminicenantes bacterium]